jgi:cobalt-zinc-cadmium efflux system protein
LAYAVVEIAMGLRSGSLALLADAGHMLTDGGALGLSLIAAKIAERPPSARRTYGYRRAEVIGAFINASSMIVISLFIAIEAIQRSLHPREVEPHGLILTAFGGLVVNAIAGVLLVRGGGNSINVRGALLHVMGDALGSLAALVAGASIALFGLHMADPIASFLIACVLLGGAVRLFREATDVLMESTPEGVDVRALERTILDTPGVSGLHDLHVWCVTPSSPVLTAHVVLTHNAHGTDVAFHVGERLRTLHGLDHVTIQPESPEPELVALRLPDTRKKP